MHYVSYLISKVTSFSVMFKSGFLDFIVEIFILRIKPQIIDAYLLLISNILLSTAVKMDAPHATTTTKKIY